MIIGGMFGLESPGLGSGILPNGKCLFLANARSGLAVLIRNLDPQRVWLPSYLCSALSEAAGGREVFYEIGFDLISSRSWLSSVQPGDLVVLIDYFGFPCDHALAAAAKSRGAWVVEDAAQALLYHRPCPSADFVLYSPRKFLGVPDGGILACTTDFPLERVRLKDVPHAKRRLALTASRGRRAFDRRGGGRNWFHQFQKAEAGQVIGPYAMTSVSHKILKTYSLQSSNARKRRSNYAFLARMLRRWALFPRLRSSVPLGFPIRIAQRDRLREALFAKEIYPAVHWPIAGIVPTRFSESHKLSAQILTLPCDQRYATDDMRRVASAVLESL